MDVQGPPGDGLSQGLTKESGMVRLLLRRDTRARVAKREKRKKKTDERVDSSQLRGCTCIWIKEERERDMG